MALSTETMFGTKAYKQIIAYGYDKKLSVDEIHTIVKSAASQTLHTDRTRNIAGYDIDSFLSWSDTEEGHEYWSEINDY